MALAYRTQLDGNLYGLVAHEQIQPGTVIMREKPLMSIDLPILYSEWSTSRALQFYNDEHDDKSHSNFIARAFKNLAKPQRDAFRLIPTHALRWRKDCLDISRVEIHGYFFPYQTPSGEPMTRLVVFFNINVINHSCRPNAIFDWQENCGVVRAITTIAVGEEVFLDRLPDDLTWATADLRKEYLGEIYDYECRCCDCKPGTYQEGDTIRRRLKFLQEQLTQFCNDSSSIRPLRSIQFISHNLAMANEYVNLLVQVGGRNMRLVEAHLFLANISELLEDRHGAQDHAVKAMVIAARAYGAPKDGSLRPAVEVLQRCYAYD